MDLPTICHLLSDTVRLRILRLLDRERLNVTELTAILGIAQSGVSRHLGLLKDAGLVSERREGGFAYFGLTDLRERWPDLWRLLSAHYDTSVDVHYRDDEGRLQEVRRLRKESFRAHGTDAGQLVPGRSWAAWARALGHLLPRWRVVDIGCGDGYLTLEVGAWAERVVGVDVSRDVVTRARALARRRGLTNVRFEQARMEHLPLDDGTMDVALLSQALHHAEAPASVLAEAKRVLAPGGRVLVLDLRQHDEAWVRGRLGDRWLGFDPDDLRRWLGACGLVDVKVSVGAQAKGDPFVVIVASGTRPASKAQRPTRRPARSDDTPTPRPSSRRRSVA